MTLDRCVCLLLVALGAVSLSCDRDPHPTEVRNLTVTPLGCNRIRMNWEAPPQLPAQFQIMIANRIVTTRSNWAVDHFQFVWLGEADSPMALVRSVDAAGAVLSATPPVRVNPLPCVVPDPVRVKVLLVDLHPPEGDGTPWTLNEARDLFFGPANSLRSVLAANSGGLHDVVGDVSGYFGVEGSDYCEWLPDLGIYNRCDPSAIMQAAVDAADPFVDFSAYDRVAILFGGKGLGGAAGLNHATDEGLIPVFHGPFELTSMVHEYGHNAVADDPTQQSVGHSGAILGCATGLFPADPANPLADCDRVSTGGTYDIDPLTSPARSGSLHFSGFHKEKMGYLRAAQVRIIDRRLVDQDMDLYDVRALTGYLDDTKKRSIRIHLTPFLYDYQLEHRNETLLDGRELEGVVIRLATHVGGGAYAGCDTLSPSGMLVLNASKRVFDDPNQDVRVEWLADLGGAGARVRIGPSRGVALP